MSEHAKGWLKWGSLMIGMVGFLLAQGLFVWPWDIQSKSEAREQHRRLRSAAEDIEIRTQGQASTTLGEIKRILERQTDQVREDLVEMRREIRGAQQRIDAVYQEVRR